MRAYPTKNFQTFYPWQIHLFFYLAYAVRPRPEGAVSDSNVYFVVSLSNKSYNLFYLITVKYVVCASWLAI